MTETMAQKTTRPAKRMSEEKHAAFREKYFDGKVSINEATNTKTIRVYYASGRLKSETVVTPADGNAYHPVKKRKFLSWTSYSKEALPATCTVTEYFDTKVSRKKSVNVYENDSVNRREWGLVSEKVYGAHRVGSKKIHGPIYSKEFYKAGYVKNYAHYGVDTQEKEIYVKAEGKFGEPESLSVEGSMESFSGYVPDAAQSKALRDVLLENGEKLTLSLFSGKKSGLTGKRKVDVHTLDLVNNDSDTVVRQIKDILLASGNEDFVNYFDESFYKERNFDHGRPKEPKKAKSDRISSLVMVDGRPTFNFARNAQNKDQMVAVEQFYQEPVQIRVDKDDNVVDSEEKGGVYQTRYQPEKVFRLADPQPMADRDSFLIEGKLNEGKVRTLSDRVEYFSNSRQQKTRKVEFLDKGDVSHTLHVNKAGKVDQVSWKNLGSKVFGKLKNIFGYRDRKGKLTKESKQLNVHDRDAYKFSVKVQGQSVDVYHGVNGDMNEVQPKINIQLDKGQLASLSIAGRDVLRQFAGLQEGEINNDTLPDFLNKLVNQVKESQHKDVFLAPNTLLREEQKVVG